MAIPRQGEVDPFSLDLVQIPIRPEAITKWSKCYKAVCKSKIEMGRTSNCSHVVCS